MYTIVLVNVKRFRALCGFYAIENKSLLLLLYHIQGWVQLHNLITSITITLKYQLKLQLQLHHHNVILNYNYTMFISITITAPFLHNLHFYLRNCGLIGSVVFHVLPAV